MKWNVVDLPKILVEQLDPSAFGRLACVEQYKGLAIGWSRLEWFTFRNGANYGDAMTQMSDLRIIKHKAWIHLIRMLLASRLTLQYGSFEQRSNQRSPWHMYRNQYVFMVNQLIFRRDGVTKHFVSTWKESCPEDPDVWCVIDVCVTTYGGAMKDDLQNRKRAFRGTDSFVPQYWKVPAPWEIYSFAKTMSHTFWHENLLGANLDFMEDGQTSRRATDLYRKEMAEVNAAVLRRRNITYGLPLDMLQEDCPGMNDGRAVLDAVYNPSIYHTVPCDVMAKRVREYFQDQGSPVYTPGGGPGHFQPTLPSHPGKAGEN